MCCVWWVFWRPVYKRCSSPKMVIYLCRCNCTGFRFHGVQGKARGFPFKQGEQALLHHPASRLSGMTRLSHWVSQTPIAASENVSKPTVLVGEDTNLLVLLCFHTKSTSRNIYFRPEPKHGAKHPPKCWNIDLLKTTVRPEMCNSVLFMHAILGCDTTYGFTVLERRQHWNLHLPARHSEDMLRSSMILKPQRLT